MTYTFGDGFDLYATLPDAGSSYWDSAVSSAASASLGTGRFTGGQAVCMVVNGTVPALILQKSSGSNDAVHHISCAFTQNATLSAVALGFFLQLIDGSTPQCSIVFRSDGTILLTSGGPTGSTLATYSSAFAANTWTAYEFEVVINNATGSFTVRKNGNSSADFTATSLATRGGTSNNYANKLQLGLQSSSGSPFNLNSQTQRIDDLLWRSDASSVSWAGDLRCLTRMPATDSSVQFTKSTTTGSQTVSTGPNAGGITANEGRYMPFTATFTGTISGAQVVVSTANAGGMKCAIYANSGSAPTTVLGTATALGSIAVGTNAFTFGSPVSVTLGTQYWLAFESDTTGGNWSQNNSNTVGIKATTAYASFPAANPTATTAQITVQCSLTYTLSTNAMMTAESQQDGLTTYVSDSTVGHNDLYTIGSLSSTPASTFMVTTRGFAEKTDAGTRLGAVQVKSGTTTVQSTSTALNTSFGWIYRTDLTDPNTSTTWTNTAVNALLIGPVVTG